MGFFRDGKEQVGPNFAGRSRRTRVPTEQSPVDDEGLSGATERPLFHALLSVEWPRLATSTSFSNAEPGSIHGDTSMRPASGILSVAVALTAQLPIDRKSVGVGNECR